MVVRGGSTAYTHPPCLAQGGLRPRARCLPGKRPLRQTSDETACRPTYPILHLYPARVYSSEERRRSKHGAMDTTSMIDLLTDAQDRESLAAAQDQGRPANREITATWASWRKLLTTLYTSEPAPDTDSWRELLAALYMRKPTPEADAWAEALFTREPAPETDAAEAEAGFQEARQRRGETVGEWRLRKLEMFRGDKARAHELRRRASLEKDRALLQQPGVPADVAKDWEAWIDFQGAHQGKSETHLEWHLRLRIIFRRAYPDKTTEEGELSRDLRNTFICGMADQDARWKAWDMQATNYATALLNALDASAHLDQEQAERVTTLRDALRTPGHLKQEQVEERVTALRDALRTPGHLKQKQVERPIGQQPGWQQPGSYVNRIQPSALYERSLPTPLPPSQGNSCLADEFVPGLPPTCPPSPPLRPGGAVNSTSGYGSKGSRFGSYSELDDEFAPDPPSTLPPSPPLPLASWPFHRSAHERETDRMERDLCGQLLRQQQRQQSQAPPSPPSSSSPSSPPPLAAWPFLRSKHEAETDHMEQELCGQLLVQQRQQRLRTQSLPLPPGSAPMEKEPERGTPGGKNKKCGKRPRPERGTPGGKKMECRYCNKKGYLTTNCRLNQDVVREERRCHYCGKKGHLISHCRLKEQEVGREVGRPRRNYNQGQWYDAPPYVQEEPLNQGRGYDAPRYIKEVPLN